MGKGDENTVPRLFWKGSIHVRVHAAAQWNIGPRHSDAQVLRTNT